MILLLALAAASPAARPTDLRLFKDWIAGCDNGLSCQAVGLVPESLPDDGITMAVERGGEAQARPVIRFAYESGEAAALLVDGKRLALHLIPEEGGARLDPADVAGVIAALRSASALDLIDAKGARIGSLSPAGASAALLYMDDRQHRIGTTSALVRPGPSSAAAIPAPPPLPQVKAAPAARGPAAKLGAARITALRKAQNCEIVDVGGPDAAYIYKLDDRRSLLLLACGSGAYNLDAIPFLVEQAGGTIRIVPAPFDDNPPGAGESAAVLVNPHWVAAENRLGSFSKARGMGDCGTRQDYIWDGERFRLVEQSEMSVCRGSPFYIRTWRARVVAR